MRLMWRLVVHRSLVSMLVRSTIRSASPIGTRKYNKDAFIIIKNQSRRDLTKSQPMEEFNPRHSLNNSDTVWTRQIKKSVRRIQKLSAVVTSLKGTLCSQRIRETFLVP